MPIVAGFGSSHSNQLMAEGEDWLGLLDHLDRTRPLYDFAGTPRPFDALAEAAIPRAEALLAPAALLERFRRTQQAMAYLKNAIATARLDALVVIGDDQREVFQDDCRPAVAVYHGPTIRNGQTPTTPLPPEDWYHRAQRRRLEEGGDVDYPCHPALATHLIAGLMARGFDITAMQALRPGQIEGHAFSFIHRAYLAGAMVPMVPVMLNTYYPPNQPSPARCLALGEAIAAATAEFPQDIRIGVLASGGLSHFLVNEALDEQVIAALKRKDKVALAALDPHLLQSGTSEIRNWICALGALAPLDLSWVSYVPGYRSHALTGVGLCFAQWS